jgi:hypothetical protein
VIALPAVTLYIQVDLGFYLQINPSCRVFQLHLMPEVNTKIPIFSVEVSGMSSVFSMFSKIIVFSSASPDSSYFRGICQEIQNNNRGYRHNTLFWIPLINHPFFENVEGVMVSTRFQVLGGTQLLSHNQHILVIHPSIVCLQASSG